MQFSQLIRNLGGNDLKLIRRDRFILSMFGFVFYIGIALYFILPWANTYLAEKGMLPGPSTENDLAFYYPLIVAFFALFTGGQLVGTIYGFMLIGEKEDDTLTAMQVTPVPLNQYLTYRVLLPTALTFFAILLLMFFIHQALLPVWQMILIAAGGSLTGPIFTLFFGVFASNKVQAFAYGKFAGIGGWFILGAWFISEPYQWIMGIFPPYWISKAYWMALAGRSTWILALLAGIVLQALLIGWLIRRFRAVVSQ